MYHIGKIELIKVPSDVDPWLQCILITLFCIPCKFQRKAVEIIIDLNEDMITTPTNILSIRAYY